MRKSARAATSTPTSEQVRKSGSNLIAGVATSAARIAEKFVPEPIRDAIDAVGSLLGFDMPRSVTADTRTVERLAPALPAGEGLDFSTRLARSAASAPFAFSGMDGDDMTIQCLASTPSMFTDFLMAESNTPGQVLASWPVNPHYCPSYVAPNRLPTALAGASLPFTYWRGALVYMMYVTCSVMHSARIRITFYPKDQGELVGFTPKSGGLSTVVDINGPHMIPFTVPFIHDRPMAIESIGRVYVSVENSFAPIGDVVTAPIRFNVYVHAADGFQVAELSGRQFVGWGDVIPPEDVPHAWPKGDSKGAAASGAGAESDHAVITSGSAYYADFYDHISKVLHAPSVWAVAPEGSSADILLALDPKIASRFTSAAIAPSPGPALARAPTNASTGYAPGANVYGVQTLVGVPALLPASASLTFLPTLHDHFALFYAYQRGGWRIKVLSAPGEAGAKTDCIVVSASPSSFQASGAFTVGSFGAYPVLSPGSSFTGRDLPAAIESAASIRLVEVEIPWRAGRLFGTTGPIPVPGPPASWPSPIQGPYYTQDTMVAAAIWPTSPATGYSMIYRAAADDYRLFGVRTPPNGAYVVQRRSAGGFAGDACYLFNPETVWNGVFAW